MFALRASTAYLILCAHQKGVAAKNTRGRSSARGAENEVWLNHRFLHFVASLQSKFYTLAPTFAFDVNIYFSSSRLFTIDPSLSLLQAIHRQLYIEFSIVFVVTLASCYSCFKYVDFVKRVIIQASDIAKRLGNNVLVNLLKDRSN